MSEKRIVLARADDWIGVYVDGVLQAEKSSMSALELLRTVGVYGDDRWVDDDCMDEDGSLPKKIEDVTWRNYG